MYKSLQKTIELLFNSKSQNPNIIFEPDNKKAILEVIELLDKGKIRVASPPTTTNHKWTVNTWTKKAILLYFQIQAMQVIQPKQELQYWDKIPLKKEYDKQNVRVVPPAVARYGSYIESGVILMPSYVNIGAYIGKNTMIDTWATVGSCAQIGKNVHLSGGVGIGGVLEPPQADPVIIEDNTFLGSRCIVVEGVRICSGAVLGSGVILTASTKIVDASGSTETIQKGEIPENSVVIPGTIPKDFPAGTYQVPCALIIGKRKESTNLKTSLNDALRTFEVPV